MPLSDATCLDALAQMIGERALRSEPLSRYSAMGIGGPADLLIVARSRDQLIEAATAAQTSGLPWHIFGGLTNLLVSDRGLSGVVILNQAQTIHFDEEQCRVYVESGKRVVPLARELVQRGWGGLTWAVGLPGTLGGAVVNNAGAFGGEIAKVLVEAEVLAADGVVHTVTPDWFDFRYRGSKLKRSGAEWLIVTVLLQLRPHDATHLATKAAEYQHRRKRTQPPGKTLGSTFKNPPGDYAGRLIEAAGLKGTRVGGVMVSTHHANFFISDGEGTAADFMALARLVQNEVARQFGVQLELEIEIIGEC